MSSEQDLLENMFDGIFETIPPSTVITALHNCLCHGDGHEIYGTEVSDETESDLGKMIDSLLEASKAARKIEK